MAHSLYKETILSRFRSQAHHYAMAEADRHKEKRNPVCGDDIRLYFRLEAPEEGRPDGRSEGRSDGREETYRLAEISFDGHGCSIAMAAAEILCERLTGKDISEARRLVEQYLSLVRDGREEARFGAELEELNAFEAVREYPSRIDCAVLAWETARDILQE
jgi:nitrogen fixation NifU-like protein